jgi:hypothetical protein
MLLFFLPQGIMGMLVLFPFLKESWECYSFFLLRELWQSYSVLLLEGIREKLLFLSDKRIICRKLLFITVYGIRGKNLFLPALSNHGNKTINHCRFMVGNIHSIKRLLGPTDQAKEIFFLTPKSWERCTTRIIRSIQY